MKSLKKIYLLALCVAGSYMAEAQTEVTYYTSMGNFKIMLTDTLTPRTVDSFKARVLDKFYDGLIFHRVIDNFVIQGGDPLGTGFGGPGYTIPDEFDPTLKNVPGALAMANSGPNTNGSQFYINLINNSSLNNHYTVFGMVTQNFSVVQSIGHVATDANDKPITDVVMDSIRITQYPAAVSSVNKGKAPSIYPNPNTGIFNVDPAGISTKVDVLSITGQAIYHTQTQNTIIVDLHTQPAGLYMVRLTNANGVSERKVIIR